MRARFAACLLALLPFAARAQDPPPQPPTFRTGVGLVRVDVTVLGRDGLPLADLAPADFDVREDGVPQTVRVLDFQRLSGQPGADGLSLEIRSPEHAAQEAAREDVRLLVIFIDDYHIRYGPLDDERLRQKLRRFIESEIQPLDLVAVMGPLTPISDLGLTRDRRELLERVGDTQGRLGGFVPPRSVIEESHFRISPAQRARVRAEVSLSALRAAAIHLGGLREGRKSILYVGQGPPVAAGGLSMFDRLSEVVDAANASNVTIHTFDPRELGMARSYSVANGTLAAETGGREIRETNDPARALRGVMSDASAYYLLGYAPERDAADGRFHEIDVKVKRRGVRVIARKGYWAPKAEELAPPPAPRAPREVTEAIGTLDDTLRPRTLVDWTGVGPVAGGLAAVSFAVAPSSPTAPPIGAVTLDVTTDAGTETGIAAVAGADDTWIARFEARPGPVSVEVAIADRAGEIVERYTRKLTVPDAGEAGARVGTPAVYRAHSIAAYRAFAAGETTPTVDRRFRRTDRVIVRLPVAAEAPAPVVTAELANQHGEAMRALTVTTSAAGPEVEVPVANLAPAPWLLRLTARFDDGGTATQLVAFVVSQ